MEFLHVDGQHDPGGEDKVKVDRWQRKGRNFAGDDHVDQPEHVVDSHGGEGIAEHEVVDLWPDITEARPELVLKKEAASLEVREVIC